MKKLIATVAIFLIVLILFSVYRYCYGNWDSFIPPDKITCYSRQYFKSNIPPEILIGKEKPKYK